MMQRFSFCSRATCPLWVLGLLLWACTEKQGPATQQATQAQKPVADTLVYKMDTLMVHDTTCHNSVYACTYVLLEVPDLAASGASPTLATNIMRTLARATGLVPDTTPRPPSLPNLAQAFVDTFTHTLVGLREDEGEDARLMPWFLEVRTQLAQHGGLVFLSTDMFTYTGGAHPNAHQGYYVFDKQTGNPVGLQDFVHDARSLAELQAMAEVKFRKQEGIKHNEDYKPYYFKDKKFVLPQNWRIARDSLEFVYNLYEIKPYADGFTYVRLPLSAVEVFIKPQYRRPQS